MIKEGQQLLDELIESKQQIATETLKKLLIKEVQENDKKIIVLDDDPTGVQTVHGVSVYTEWTQESIEKGFEEDRQMFFILTNSRSFSREKTLAVHKEITERIVVTAHKLNKDFLIIVRGDSTLRGHYPEETQTITEVMENSTGQKIDGEIICPFFKEGGRYTYNNIHYVNDAGTLVPSGETEFAKDKTFGYKASHLGEWIEEKSLGSFKSKDATYISIEELRNGDLDAIQDKLLRVTAFNKIVVNAVDYSDLEVFCVALLRAMKKGKRFVFRTAASFVKVIGGISSKDLLARSEIIKGDNTHGGLIIIGSHTQKTTSQLQALKDLKGIEMIEINSHLVVDKQAFGKELEYVLNLTIRLLKKSKTVVVFTKRERLELNTGNQEDELEMATRISEGTTSIVERLTIVPKFIIGKGGITSSDIGVRGLGVICAQVAGQIKPGIPVWITDSSSKFPSMPYIIFPGNVGEETTLREIVEELLGVEER